MDKLDLRLGDCLVEMKSIPDRSVDAVITDPPYGMSFRSGYSKNKHKRIKNDTCLDWLDPFVQECFRLTKANMAHYVFCSFHKIDVFKRAFEKYFKVKNVLVWEKNNTSMRDLKADFAPKVEFILLLHKGRRLINGKRDPNIFKFKKTKNELHPTEKPVDLMEYLIEKFTDLEDTIMDPFMGSGTTGVAALHQNRNFIGIEQEVDYFETATNRITLAWIKNKIANG